MHRIDEAVIVVDANVIIDACQALDRGMAPPLEWWTLPENRLGAALSLFAGAAAPLHAEVVIAIDVLLEDVVLRKLTQPAGAGRPEDRGLGWSAQRAGDAYEAVLLPLHRLGRTRLINPAAPSEFLAGADYEDSRIWGLFARARGTNPLADAFLVTRDRAFMESANSSCPRLHSGRPEWVACPPSAMAKILGFYRVRTSAAPPAGPSAGS